MSAVRFKNILVCGCSAIGLLAGSAAYAQDTGQIQEVTVTAQRRVENVQKVPIAISAITPDTAKAYGVLDTDQLATAVPGMVFGHEINGATAFIRGIGPNSNGTGEESSVAMYLDDLYIEGGNASIFAVGSGVSSVDVLKGPQGTLFGRNATGGVIQVRTKDPEFDPSADITVGYGNYETTSANAYITGGITDNLAANLSLFGNDEAQGWGKDVTTGQRAFTSNDWGIRNKWLWEPTSSTRVLLAMSHSFIRSEVGLGFNQVPSFAAAGGHGYCPGQAPTSPFACPAATPGTGYVGFYNTADIRNDSAINKHDAVELRIDQDLGFAKAVSITGWQRSKGYADFNQDGSAYGGVVTLLNQSGRDWSQEVQLLNPDNASYSSWFTWIVGGFYMHDMSGYSHAHLQGIAEGFPIQVVPADDYLDLTDNVTTVSWAGYAQGTAELYPGLKLTLGGRYTEDKRTFTGGVYLSPALGGTPELPACFIAPIACPTVASDKGATHSWPMTTYRAALNYDFTDDVMGYLSYNRGVKSGQYDTFGTAATGPVVTPPVNPEVLKATELGVKSEWLDHTLRVNADVFHYDYTNQQYAIIVNGGTQLINAAASTLNGGEADVTAVLSSHFTLTGGVAILYGHYTNFKNAPDYFIPGCSSAAGNCVINATGANMIRAPHFSGNIAADYTFDTSIGTMDLNANLSHTDTFEWFPDGSLNQPAVNLIGASLTWTNPTGMYDIRLWGNNLTNEKYYSFGSESIGDGKQFSPEAPRTYGIEASVHL